MASGPLLTTEVEGVFRIPGGYGMSPTSLGGWGYVIVQGSSAVLVDVPYYSSRLATEVRKLAPGGVSHILLTHDDWVGMGAHEQWKSAFPEATRTAHRVDCSGRSVEQELSGSGPWDVAGFRADLVPGHSQASLFFSSSELSVVFTGDSIALWDGQPTGFGFRCHFNRVLQAASLRSYVRMTPFCKALLPSHGLPKYFENEEERLSFFDSAAEGLDSGKSGL